MRTRTASFGFVALFAVAALAAPARAQAQALDRPALERALDRAAAAPAGNAAAYEGARAEVLAFGEAAIPALAEAGADARWTRENWRVALVAEACRVRLADPAFAGAVDVPRGIDPAHYRKFRKPEPYCQHDLARMGRNAVPLLLERFFWTLDGRAYSEGEAGRKERRSLALAALFVPGQLGDARARYAVESVLNDRSTSAELRAQAAVSAAQCGGAEAAPAIARVLDSADEPIAVREACAWALGRVATPQAGEALFERLAGLARAGERTDADRRLARAVLNGIGLLGDRWAWEARGAAAAEQALSLRRACAEQLVQAIRTFPEERDIIATGLALIASPESLAAVRALAADEAAPAAVRDAAAAVVPAVEAAVARGQ